MLNPPIGTLRMVPTGRNSVYSGALSRRERGRYEAAGMLRPQAIFNAPELSREPRATLEVWVCPAHGQLTGTRCPSGCSRSLLTRIEVPVTVGELRRERRRFSIEDLGKAVAPREGASQLLPDRDAQGRFLPDYLGGVPEEAPKDEAMPEELVRSELRKLLAHLPRGAKKPLARVCGYRGRSGLSSLRGVAKGRALLPDACRRRISRVLIMIARDELLLVQIGPEVRQGGRAWLAWKHRSSGMERRAVKFQH